MGVAGDWLAGVDTVPCRPSAAFPSPVLVYRNIKALTDPATKLQAQADIAEDGYWGVSQTSQRILDFATALTGGDPSKIDEMREAFEKGYKLAEKKWGGNLPDISRQTYDAVLDGFDKMARDAGIEG